MSKKHLDPNGDFAYFKHAFIVKYAHLMAEKYIDLSNPSKYQLLEKELENTNKAFNRVYIDKAEAEKGEDLIDLEDGPFSKKELANAVEVLGGHLRMNSDLYKGYQSNIAQAIYDEFDESEPDEGIQDFEEFCNKAAERFMETWLTNIEEHLE